MALVFGCLTLRNIVVQRDDTRLRVRSCIEARMGDKG